MFSPRPKLSNDVPINHQIEFIYWLEVIISCLVIELNLRLELFCTRMSPLIAIVIVKLRGINGRGESLRIEGRLN